MKNQINLIGAPSSAGAHAPGQEKAPALLRQAGILEVFSDVGLQVQDMGDLPGFRYRHDPGSPRARNIKDVVTNARRVADFVGETLGNGGKYIVLGGDCTNGVGAIAGATRDNNIRTGVIYLDMHGDLNTPETVASGALDWMGVAHLLGADGCVPEYANLDDRCPVLQNDQIVLLGWDYDGSNSDAEREAIIRRKLDVVFLDELQANPTAAAKRAMQLLGPVDRIVVHFDVDVIDFAECPLGENYRHGEGCTLAQAMTALSTIASTPEYAGVTVAQLNPDHGEEDLATLKLFSIAFTEALAGKSPLD
jgi:arginase